MFNPDPQPFFVILNSVLHHGLETDEDRVRECQTWIMENWQTLRKVLNVDERRILTIYMTYVQKHPDSIPSRSDMDQLIREKQQTQGMVDVMTEYDRYAPDLEEHPATSLHIYLDQRKVDYEKYKLLKVLSVAGDIVVGSLTEEGKQKDQKIVYAGPRDAIKYLLSRIEAGLLIDAKQNIGGDTAEVGVPVVAETIKKDMAGPHEFIRTNSPLNLLEIGPENEIKWVGIAGFTNHRKSTLLFSLCYLAAARGMKVLIVPRECSVESAWRKIIWLHAHRMQFDNKLPPLVDSRNPKMLTQEHEALVRWLGEDMKQKGIRIEIRNASDWAAVNSSVNAHLNEPFDVLAVDYIGHLDTPGAKDQREGIREVYRMAQALTQDYEAGRGLCILTPMQVNKAGEKIAAPEDKLLLEWGVYEPGNVGIVEYHTDAARGMDALIGVWSGPEFKQDGLIKVSCVKSRGKWFQPFFMQVDEHTQRVRFIEDYEAYKLLGERHLAQLETSPAKNAPKPSRKKNPTTEKQITDPEAVA